MLTFKRQFIWYICSNIVWGATLELVQTHTHYVHVRYTCVCVCVCILKSVGRMLYYYSRWDPVLIIILYFSGITASSTWCNVTGRSEWESLPVESLNNQKVQCLQVFNADLLLQFFKRKKIRAPGQRDRETGRQTIATAADWRVSGSCSHWWPTAYFMEGSRIYNKRKKKHPLLIRSLERRDSICISKGKKTKGGREVWGVASGVSNHVFIR